MACSGNCSYRCSGQDAEGDAIWSNTMNCTEIECHCDTALLPQSATTGTIVQVPCVSNPPGFITRIIDKEVSNYENGKFVGRIKIRVQEIVPGDSGKN